MRFFPSSTLNTKMMDFIMWANDNPQIKKNPYDSFNGMKRSMAVPQGIIWRELYK